MAAYPACVPSFNFSKGLQAFYGARGMWAGGEPQGWLSTMLGPRVVLGCTWFYASAEQIGELMRDLALNGPSKMTSHQLAQSLRRLREAVKHSERRDERAPESLLELLASNAPGSYGTAAAATSASDRVEIIQAFADEIRRVLGDSEADRYLSAKAIAELRSEPRPPGLRLAWSAP